MEPTINNEVPGVIQQESFFDRYLIKSLLLLNIITFFTFFITLGFADPHFIVLYWGYLISICLFFPIVTVLLWLFNYHNKKAELFSVVKKLGIIIAISLLVCFVFGFMMTSFLGGMV